MDYTTNYQLPVWAETDRILRSDFNDMTEKIDAMLGQAPGKGNCQFYFTSYRGSRDTGSAEPNSLEFPKQPVLMLVFCSDAWMIAFPQRGLGMMSDTSGIYRNACSYQGNNVTWYTSDGDPEHQMNDFRDYAAVALLNAEE